MSRGRQGRLRRKAPGLERRPRPAAWSNLAESRSRDPHGRPHPALPSRRHQAPATDPARRVGTNPLLLFQPLEHGPDPHRRKHPVEFRPARHLGDAPPAGRGADLRRGRRAKLSDARRGRRDPKPAAIPQRSDGHIFVSWLHPSKEQKLVVVGSEQMAVFDDTAQQKLLLYPHRVDWASRTPEGRQGRGRRRRVGKGRAAASEECQHFLDCVATPPDAPLRRPRGPARA